MHFFRIAQKDGVASRQMRNIETFPSMHMYLYIQRKVALYYHCMVDGRHNSYRLLYDKLQLSQPGNHLGLSSVNSD